MRAVRLAIALSAFLALSAVSAVKVDFHPFVCGYDSDAACPSEPRAITCPVADTCYSTGRPVTSSVDQVYRLFSKSGHIDHTTPLDTWEVLSLSNPSPAAMPFLSATSDPKHGVYAAGISITSDPCITFTPKPGRTPFRPVSGTNWRVTSLSTLPDASGRSSGHRVAMFYTVFFASFPAGVNLLTAEGELLSTTYLAGLGNADPLDLGCITNTRWVIVARATRDASAMDKTIVVMWSATAGESWKHLYTFPVASARYQRGSAAISCSGTGCVAASGDDQLSLALINFPLEATEPTVTAVPVDTGAPVDVVSMTLSARGDAAVVLAAPPRNPRSPGNTGSSRDGQQPGCQHSGNGGDALALYISAKGGDGKAALWERGAVEVARHVSPHAVAFTGAAFIDGSSKGGIVVGRTENMTGVYTTFSRVG